MGGRTPLNALRRRQTGAARPAPGRARSAPTGGAPRRTNRLTVAPSGVDGVLVEHERLDVDDLAALALAELDGAVDEREQGVVATDADVAARVELGAALADDDRARSDLAAAEDLDAEALSVGVASVAGGTGCRAGGR